MSDFPLRGEALDRGLKLLWAKNKLEDYNKQEQVTELESRLALSLSHLIDIIEIEGDVITFEQWKEEFLEICASNGDVYVSDDTMLEWFESETEPYDAYYEMFGEGK